MNLAKKAFKKLYPDKEITRDMNVKYSARFKPYNANVRYNSKKIIFKLSKDWKEVSENIKIGMIQQLFLKVYNEKRDTLYTELYESFVKNLPKFSVADEIDPLLKESFDRNNEKYFNRFMETPNLVWGRESFNKLGSYEYASNTIIISTVLKKREDLLDYVMYHEMLHKKLKYKSKNGRNYYHTSKFKKLESEFEDKDAEKKLEHFLKRKRIARAFQLF
mgnify:CR=1 FL=1